MSWPRQYSALTPRKRWQRWGPLTPRAIRGCRFNTASNSSGIRNSFCGYSSALVWQWAVHAIAWHPRRASLVDPLADLEERKALILLGVVGAVVAELSGTSQTLAFVIFGIGALLRFRTVLDNPKLTGEQMTACCRSWLACGMDRGRWLCSLPPLVGRLVDRLDSHSSCRVRIRLDDTEDPKPVFGNGAIVARSTSVGFKVPRCTRTRGQMVFLLYIPSGVDPRQLEAEVRSSLKKHHVSKITVDVV